MNLTETTTKHPDGNSKESTQSYTPINSQSGLGYEGGTGNKSKGEGVEANDESDGWDTDDDSESMSSTDSAWLDSTLFDAEALFTDDPALELPEVIAQVIRLMIKSKDRDRDSLLARRLISRLVKNAGQWPPAQA